MTDGKDTRKARVYPSGERPAVTVDAIGLLCPLPVLKLQKALRGLAPGACAELTATDPASRIDVPHFCNEAGHALREMREADGTFVYLVEKSA